MKKPKVPAEISDAAKLAAEQQILEQSKRIDFYLTEYSVEILANKMKDGDFKVPPYQREFVWEPERQSRFIESVIMGLPIPFLFFWEMGDGRLEIVDGSQRLRTLQEFILGDLRLGDLESLPTVSNFRFVDLPESRQRKIKNRSIRGIVLNEHADEQARFDMFERINTGSKVAEAPEVRRGALAGPFMALIIKLADQAGEEVAKHRMLLNLRHVFHRDEVRLNLSDQASKAAHQPPIIAASLLASASAVGGERLTRGTSRHHGQRTFSEERLEAIGLQRLDVFLEKGGIIVCLVGMPTRGINIYTCDDRNASSDEPVGQTTNPAEQIHGVDNWNGLPVFGTRHAEAAAGRFAGTTNWCPSMYARKAPTTSRK